MAGGENDGRRGATIGQRALDGGGGGEGSGDSGNDFTRNARESQRIHFFGGAAKDERVANFEADDALAFACLIDHEEVDLFLRDALHAAAFADVQDPRTWIGSAEHCGRNKIVVQHDIAGGEQARGFHGEQIRVARACSDEIDGSLLRRCSSSHLSVLPRKRELPGWAGRGIAYVPLRELMQQHLAFFAGIVRGQHVAAK